MTGSESEMSGPASRPAGRKYRMTMLGVLAILLIGVASSAARQFAGLDIDELARWAMITIATLTGLGAGSIAYEDAHTGGR